MAIDKEIGEGKVFAIIAYWGFLCILPLILKKDNKFAVYHGKQGLVLFIFLVAGFIFNIIPLQFIWRAVLVIYIFMLVWGNVHVLLGRYGRLPVVSVIAEKISL